MESLNDLTGSIISSSFKIHSRIGPGLLESSYKECLYYELKKNGLYVEKEKAIPLFYDEVRMEIGYRADLIVENKVIVEIKSIEAFNDIHIAQVLTYMNLSGCKLGLLLNFNTVHFKTGIKRLIL